jgi:inner membrane protein
MDVLVQIILGACLGELFLGKKIGALGALWGVVVAVVPSLAQVAVAAFPVGDHIVFHQDIGHSLLFAGLGAPLLGRCLTGLNPNAHLSWRAWSLWALWVLLGVTLLQCFTVDGAPLFWPFNDYRLVLGAILIIDPLYAIPMLVGLLTALYFHRTSCERQVANILGFLLSTLYVGFTLINQWQVYTLFEASLRNQGHGYYERLFVYPVSVNNVGWIGMAEDAQGVWVGYYYADNRNQPVTFQHLGKDHTLLVTLLEGAAYRRLFGLFGGFHGGREPAGVLLEQDNPSAVKKHLMLIEPRQDIAGLS